MNWFNYIAYFVMVLYAQMYWSILWNIVQALISILPRKTFSSIMWIITAEICSTYRVCWNTDTKIIVSQGIIINASASKTFQCFISIFFTASVERFAKIFIFPKFRLVFPSWRRKLKIQIYNLVMFFHTRYSSKLSNFQYYMKLLTVKSKYIRVCEFSNL